MTNPSGVYASRAESLDPHVPYVCGWVESQRATDALAGQPRSAAIADDFTTLNADVNVFGEGVVCLAPSVRKPLYISPASLRPAWWSSNWTSGPVKTGPTPMRRRGGQASRRPVPDALRSSSRKGRPYRCRFRVGPAPQPNPETATCESIWRRHWSVSTAVAIEADFFWPAQEGFRGLGDIDSRSTLASDLDLRPTVFSALAQPV